ncbi:MAG TPA: LamG domain-containing protein [Candidatus Acidoferrales bacterium]|nr:LamG domain-containing protein [Candidatus Acidoferrales bacterium]
MTRISLLLLVLGAPAVAQWTNGYTYEATFTVSAGQVSGTLTNFTVVVAGTAADFKTVVNGGRIQHTCTQTLYGLTIPADFIFTSDSAGTSVLTWQFDTYNAATGAYSAHVRLPSVAAGTTLYAWYGKSSVTTCQGGTASAAWDGSTVAALAMPNGVALNAVDYFGNAVTAGPSAPGAAAGPSADDAGAATFAGNVNSYLQVANGGRRGKPFTGCAWFKFNAHTSGGADFVFGDDDGGSGFAGFNLSRSSTSGTMQTYITDNGPNYNWWAVGATAINSGVWHQACTVASSSTLQLYVDGATEGTSSDISSMTPTNKSATYVALGRTGAYAGGEFWNGSIAEFTIDNTNRGAAWIAARYKNLLSPSGFWTITTGLTSGVQSSGTFTVSPASIPAGHPGNIALTLTGTGTSWSGATVFALNGVGNITKISQTVTSGTSATIVVQTGTATGTLSINETGTGSAVATVGVASPTLTISPAGGNLRSIQTLTLTGGNTVWTQEAVAGLFTVSGGAGSGIGTATITGDSSGSVSLTVGTAAGSLTITDTSTGATATFTAGGSGAGSGTCAVVWGQ